MKVITEFEKNEPIIYNSFMQIDNLDGSIFKSRNGKDYRTPVKVDRAFVENYFESRGFDVESFDQIFRHATTKLKKNGIFLFAKIASTEDIGERTYNEMIWNQKIGKEIGNGSGLIFRVPKVIESGRIGNKFFFISEFYPGNFLAGKNPPSVTGFSRWLGKIVETNIFLLGLNRMTFPRDVNELAYNNDFSDLTYNQDQIMLKDLNEFNLGSVLEKEKQADLSYIGVVHGDFVPWHMISSNDHFVLIDGEHGTTRLPRFYDIAYMFHRLYAVAESPAYAKEYINKVLEAISPNLRDAFIKEVNSLIASRVISGFWNAKNDGKDNFNYHFKVKNDLLMGNIFN